MPVRIEDLVSNIIEAYVELDSNLHIVDMNANAETLLRRDRSSALGETLDELIPDANRSQHWPAFVELLKSGRSGDVSIFYPAQYRWHDVKVIPVSGGGIGLLMRDVTDRQWLIRREAERVYLQNVFEEAPVAISIMRGKNLVIEYMNRRSRQLVGDRNIMGLSAKEALPDLEQKELFDIVEQVLTTGTPFQAQNIYVRFDRNNDGVLEDGYFDVSYQAVRDFDGTLSGVLGVSVEVTEPGANASPRTTPPALH